MFVTSARQGREMGPGRGRCPPPHTLSELLWEAEERLRCAALTTRRGQCGFAYICIPSCAQLHPALGHEFVAGGSGQAGPTRGGRSLRAPALRLSRPGAGGFSRRPEPRPPQPCPPHLPGSRRLLGICVPRAAAGQA